MNYRRQTARLEGNQSRPSAFTFCMTRNEGRLAGVLLGTALGDALGLPAERLSPRAIARRWGRIERFHLLGRTGFVSDDTEQAALLAQSLARHPDDLERCVQDFRRALLGWSLRLPFGAGKATLQACIRIALGLRVTGMPSAGNGAAMRAAVLGVFFQDDPEKRRKWGRALAEVTHRDERAVQGALYVAELAAACSAASPDARLGCVEAARRIIAVPALGSALDAAQDLAEREATTAEAAATLKTTGYVVHTVSFASFCFLRHGEDPIRALVEVVNAGGDTDSTGAILGAWVGALHGEVRLPSGLIDRIHDGPFGPTHLRAQAACLARRQAGEPSPVPGYSPLAAFLRNVALVPVLIGHLLRRMVP